MEESNNEMVEHDNGVIKMLLDSAYPLLKQLRDICPGTYKHSQALAAMIEAISLELDLDVDLMKVAALYHDVGKLMNPKYFTENQLDDENPHDELDPMVSYNLITRHVSDSVLILINDINFPRHLIEIISQHHGSSVLTYFFKQSKEGTKKDMFRYKTHCPTCVESAILMITDRVEATSRSLVQTGKFDPAMVITSVINDLLDDGQLDEVEIKLGSLKKIKEILGKELEGVYQKRVSYSDNLSATESDTPS